MLLTFFSANGRVFTYNMFKNLTSRNDGVSFEQLGPGGDE